MCIRDSGGTSYSDLGTKIFRNNYNGPLSYFAIPIPELRAFYGDSKGFIPTFIDLADYKNQKFNIQFRWGSDDAGGGTGSVSYTHLNNMNNGNFSLFNKNGSKPFKSWYSMGAPKAITPWWLLPFASLLSNSLGTCWRGIDFSLHSSLKNFSNSP